MLVLLLSSVVTPAVAPIRQPNKLVFANGTDIVRERGEEYFKIVAQALMAQEMVDDVVKRLVLWGWSECPSRSPLLNFIRGRLGPHGDVLVLRLRRVLLLGASVEFDLGSVAETAAKLASKEMVRRERVAENATKLG